MNVIVVSPGWGAFRFQTFWIAAMNSCAYSGQQKFIGSNALVPPPPPTVNPGDS